MKKFLNFFLCLQITLNITAQQGISPYKLSLNVDIPLATNSTGILAGSFLLGTSYKLPPKESLPLLDRNKINKFDRRATSQSSKAAGYASDAVLYVAVAFPLLQLINKSSRADFGKVALISAEAFTLNLAITNMFKETVHRKRPLLYNPNVPSDVKYKKDNFNSFFSGHTSTIACMSFSFAEMYADYNPRSKLKPYVWTLAAVGPSAVGGILRYKAGKHFWTDIITGYVVGAAIGLTVPYLHSKGLEINK